MTNIKAQIKKMTTLLKSNHELDFDKLSSYRLKDESLKASSHDNSSLAYKLDIASDIKELLGDRSLPFEDRDFRIGVLLEQFFLA